MTKTVKAQPVFEVEEIREDAVLVTEPLPGFDEVLAEEHEVTLKRIPPYEKMEAVGEAFRAVRSALRSVIGNDIAYEATLTHLHRAESSALRGALRG